MSSSGMLKRKVPVAVMSAVSSKRARLGNSTTIEGWEGMIEDMDDTGDSTPASPVPSTPLSAVYSIAETAATSTSKRPKIFACEMCAKTFDRPARVQIHMRSHTNERPFVCSEVGCGKTFLRNEHLTRHTVDVHSEKRDHVCTHPIGRNDVGEELTCGKTFTTATRLRRHIAAHEAKEETTCSFAGCGKLFRKQETLQGHIKTEHLNEKPFQCSYVDRAVEGETEGPECQASFTKAEQLKQHIARDHSGARYFCDMCSSTSLLLHSCHTDQLLAPVGFQTYADMQTHIRTTHPPTCTQCGVQCETNRALKAHMDIEHSALLDRQTHVCEWPGCGRGFTKAGNLKVHYQSVHKKTRSFVCGEHDLSGHAKVGGWNGQGCGAAFGTKGSLGDHIRTRHLGLPLKPKPSRVFKKAMKAGSSVASTPGECDEITTPLDAGAADEAMAMLTGHGYDSLYNRGIACLVQGCQHRFGNDYALSEHLDLTHSWQIDDIHDRMAERDAIAGGDFWIGGAGEGRLGQAVDDDAEDEILRRSLAAALEGSLYGGAAKEAGVDMGVNMDFNMGMEGLVLDPALVAMS
ncbi:hypothetical protein LTR62_005487 [Meristemomyces frigidus]|uniref:C2H2-type domain-containing protein n=1 Tax=Meristemomyces frigidus TaxID=1508187 RepID=A0AAN7TDB4_9PEZI|nr:hypothetical protein LTR62_005487 [Meristemomyces frigidus]